MQIEMQNNPFLNLLTLKWSSEKTLYIYLEILLFNSAKSEDEHEHQFLIRKT